LPGGETPRFAGEVLEKKKRWAMGAGREGENAGRAEEKEKPGSRVQQRLFKGRGGGLKVEEIMSRGEAMDPEKRKSGPYVRESMFRKKLKKTKKSMEGLPELQALERRLNNTNEEGRKKEKKKRRRFREMLDAWGVETPVIRGRGGGKRGGRKGLVPTSGKEKRGDPKEGKESTIIKERK